MSRAWVSFGAGLVFACGLAIAGMTQPGKVLGFLDVTGSWDPSLALVMVGAIGVYLPVYRVAMRRGAPLLEPEFALPRRKHIDGPLLAGAGLFGIGWGIAGFCPGPALASSAAGMPAAIVFALAMVAGMILHRLAGAPGQDP